MLYELLLTYKFTIGFFCIGGLILTLGFCFNWFFSLMDFEKNSVYECGFDCFLYNANLKNYDIEFLIFAILFLILDLELVLLTPYVLTIALTGIIGLGFVYFFLFFLLIGFLIEYFRGVLHLNLAFLN
jgi:NADH:ubiquinone oxidoreductase subunit 3 (subunit A)